MFETILYVLVFLGALGALGFWIMKARSAMKSAGRNRADNDQNLTPPSSRL